MILQAIMNVVSPVVIKEVGNISRLAARCTEASIYSKIITGI